MKPSHLLPLVALSSALVLPTELESCDASGEVSSWYDNVVSEKDSVISEATDAFNKFLERISHVTKTGWEQVEETSSDVFDSASNALDSALEAAFEKADDLADKFTESREAAQEWVEAGFNGIHDSLDSVREELKSGEDEHHGYEHEHHGYEHDHDHQHHFGDHEHHFEHHDEHEDHHHHEHFGMFGGHDHHDEDEDHHHHEHFGMFGGHDHHDHDDDDHHGHHGHHGDHGHHGGHGGHDHAKPNKTVLELIASSKYTTKLAKLVSKYPDLVKALNSTDFNGTVFAPTDKAFAKIPDKVFDKFSKKDIAKLLAYHVVDGLYPAKRVLFTHTAPTYLKVDSLSDEEEAQRISIRKGLKGITINFFSRIVAVDIFATNGIIHGVDTPIFPPIGAVREIELFPGAFSTLELGLAKAGLLDELNTTDHNGGTLFAPNNWAFQKLGPKINAFLFSPPGQKYLKALLEYHIVPENTLYTDAYYKAGSSKDDADANKIHVDLPTLLKDRSLAIDIASFGPLIIMKVNGFNNVAVTDVVAEDGVIHIVSSVIIPPKNPSSVEEVEEELTVESLMERLEPFVKEAEPKEDLR